MEIIHKEYGREGVFNAVENGKQIGEMTYSWVGEDRIAIDHTGVSPAYEGQGVGKKMVMEAVEFAREKNIKIVPICPFVDALFTRDKNLSDVCI